MIFLLMKNFDEYTLLQGGQKAFSSALLDSFPLKMVTYFGKKIIFFSLFLAVRSFGSQIAQKKEENKQN